MDYSRSTQNPKERKAHVINDHGTSLNSQMDRIFTTTDYIINKEILIRIA